MEYVKPKIEFSKIENRDNIADLTVSTGNGGTIEWGDFFGTTNSVKSSNVNYY